MWEKLVKELKANLERVAEIDAEAELTEGLKAEQDTLIAAQEGLKAKIVRAKEQVEMGNFLDDAEANPPVEKRIVAAMPIADAAPMVIDAKVVPVSARRLYGTIRSFHGDDKELKAYRFGQWFMGVAGIQSSIDYCNNTGMPLAVHNEDTNTAGGYLVPEEFGTDMTRLTLEYGAFRSNTNVVPMMSDTRTDPRQTAFMTATWVGESEAATESDIAWDQIRLVAKKLKAVTRITNELSADTAISVGDQVIRDIARAFALAEDTAGYNGTGLSATGGITGVIQSLSDAAGTPTTTSAGGIIVGTGNAYSELTLVDFHKVIGTCPTFARRGASWHASPFFHNTVMMKLQTAAGGNTVSDISGGGMSPFLGYPVVPVEVMPTAEANSQICALFGALDQASKLGDRMTRTISTSEHATVNGVNVWEVDQLAIKGVERIDINVHDVGNTTTAGPIVGLQTLNA